MAREMTAHQGASIGNIGFRACQRFPENTALVGEEGRLSYRELLTRIRRMMAVFRSLGLSSNSAMAILATNHLDVVVVYMAALASGFRFTPLAAAGSLADQAFVLEDARIDALVIDPAFADRLPAIVSAVPGLKTVMALGNCPGAVNLSDLTDREPDNRLGPARPTQDVAMIYYTGGTTGRPKGVALTHEAGMAAVMMLTAEWEWPADLRLLVTTPVSHAAGAFLWPTLLKGGVFHVLPTFSAEAFAAYVEREAITATFLVPTMIYKLLDAGIEPARLRSIETVFYGAAPMDPARLAQAIGRFGPIFMQLYGQTEAPSCISYLAKSQHRLDDPESLTSCGVPLANVDIALLDEAGGTVAEGEIGEICVRGSHVMKGYWERPAETAEAFAGGWLHTGDLGRFDAAGRLHICDRKKDMIISGGFNVYPSEIEAVISARSEVAEVAVVGIADSVWGEAVVAAVVLTEGAALQAAEIQSLVRAAKGPVQTPKQIVFLDRLPVTPIGKIDKKALRAELSGKV
jgi:fatty-acyl-CoA synthase